MKKTLIIAVALLALLLLLPACGGNSAYGEYKQAYKMLQKAESFAIGSRDYSHTFVSATGEETTGEWFTDSQVVKTESGYDGISSISVYGEGYGDSDSYSGEVYFHDGRSYSAVHEDYMAEGEFTRVSQACDPDFAFRIATEGLLDIPKEVIVKQRVFGTNVAKLRTLEFTLDPEKFYAWTFGEPDANTLYVAFREPPIYAVSLDEEGRLQHVRLNWCMVSTEANPSRWERDVEVYFLSWDDIELEFPELNEEDYPDMSDPADQGNDC
ncbi:MAG: hypothetical protein IJH59_02920 [Firmicutes bacterium]|nr:hypothetical protein [Bacillota bacterium]